MDDMTGYTNGEADHCWCVRAILCGLATLATMSREREAENRLDHKFILQLQGAGTGRNTIACFLFFIYLNS